MMTLRPQEKLLAIKISQALQHFFDKNPGQPNLRSTDAYDILVTKGLVERDRHQGLKFRAFLQKLKKAQALDLLPQCCPLPGPNNTNQWFFHSAAKRTVKAVHLNTRPATTQASKAALENLQKAIEKLPKRDPNTLEFLDQQTRKTYPRAYEYWTEKEKSLLHSVYQLTQDLFVLSKLFQRQPSAIERQLATLPPNR